jgi:HEAT repeat protein
MHNLRFLLLPVFVIVFAAAAFSADTPKPQKQISDESISSLLMGVESENFGLQTSSAFMLGELRSSQAVIPLMRMLHSSEKEEARIMAALSLSKIDSQKGMYAVKQAAKFDESERVRRICFSLYLNSLGIEPVSSNHDVARK